jgi:hypothetical protein
MTMTLQRHSADPRMNHHAPAVDGRRVVFARSLGAGVLVLVLGLACGCGRQTPPTVTTPPGDPVESVAADEQLFEPQSYEFTAEDLLSARLTRDEAAEGWLRLFDGHTLFGWEITGRANWRVEDGAIVVDSGDQCLLCTSLPWQDYELTLEFKADPGTNSGVFLRTPMTPEDPAIDCYEVNIAPADNAFPTASVVKREQASGVEAETPAPAWREMKMRLDGGQLDISIDGKLACQYSDPIGLSAGRIGLQHNSGRVAFKNIRLRPLGLTTLLDAKLSQWKKYPEMTGEFSVTDEGWLHVRGGKTQLESKASYDDFVLLAEYKLPQADINSGIFFRCIPGDEMMGYECQLSNAMNDGMPLSPADCGTGGIFRRQDARVVAGEVDQWTSVVLVAAGDKMAAWVGGLQVSDWQDDREPNENPRRGLRLDAGTIMIQGHDADTDALLKQIAIAPIAKPPTE